MPNFDPALMRGVASASLELFAAEPELDALYVPIGLGSGICAALAARDALGLRTRIVGVVAEGAPTYALSFAAGRPVPTTSATRSRTALAVRVPNADALDRDRAKALERVVAVSEAEIRSAIRVWFSDTHNVAEGAAAAALAACLRERDGDRREVAWGVVLTRREHRPRALPRDPVRGGSDVRLTLSGVVAFALLFASAARADDVTANAWCEGRSRGGGRGARAEVGGVGAARRT